MTGANLGVALMLAGMLLFSLNDAIGKWLVVTYSVGQVLLIRSAVALVILVPFLRAGGVTALIRVERPGVQALRVVASTAEVFCFYTAVAALPLADVMTYWLAAPIYVAVLAPLLLGERVGAVRWGAIAMGFAGVVLALDPTGAVALGATPVALLGSLCFALLMLTGRSLRATPDTTLVFWQTLGALAAGAVLAPLGWTTPEGLDLALLGLLGVVAMGAHVCVNRSLKLAPASRLAPLQYTLLLWAIVLGWLFFDEVPRSATVAGGAIIVAAGLIVALYEGRAAPRAS